MKRITGLVAAAYNPMNPDQSLAPEKIGELVDYAVRQKFEGLFVNGSTGEFPSLSTRERQICAEAYLESARNRLPVILNIASCSIEELRMLAEHALPYDPDAFCLMTPFYFKPANAREFADFVKEAAKFCGDKPLFLYHAPALADSCFDLPEFLKIMLDEVPSFAGVKYTGSDLFEFRWCTTLSPRLQMFYGRDEMLLGALAMGAEAAIGTTFNYLPRVYRGVIDAFNANEMEKARELMDVSRRAVLISRQFGISSLKLFMKLAGIDIGPMRTPCNRITPEQEKAFFETVKNADLEQYLG